MSLSRFFVRLAMARLMARRVPQRRGATELDYASVSRFTRRRKGKHNQIVADILADVENVSTAHAIKIPPTSWLQACTRCLSVEPCQQATQIGDCYSRRPLVLIRLAQKRSRSVAPPLNRAPVQKNYPPSTTAFSKPGIVNSAASMSTPSPSSCSVAEVTGPMEAILIP